MSIIFRPANLYDRFEFAIGSPTDQAIHDMLTLDVSGGNAGTIFALLGLPVQSPDVGDISCERLHYRLDTITRANALDYVESNAESLMRFSRYQHMLIRIIAYCLGAQCDLTWS